MTRTRKTTRTAVNATNYVAGQKYTVAGTKNWEGFEVEVVAVEMHDNRSWGTSYSDVIVTPVTYKGTAIVGGRHFGKEYRVRGSKLVAVPATPAPESNEPAAE